MQGCQALHIGMNGTDCPDPLWMANICKFLIIWHQDA
jgi:hypothetical protein